MPKTAQKLYQLKVTLKGSKPPIWRRFLIASSVTLPELHGVLQVIMGWSDYHLHQFTAGGHEFGVLDPHFGLDDVDGREGSQA